MEEVTGLRTVLHMWKHIFDYRGRASRKEYWIPFLVHAGILVAALMCLCVSAVLREVSYSVGVSAGRWIAVFFAVAGVVLLLYLIISILPWISLTIRRLHDAGKSGWWTILLLVVGIGTVILLFLCSLQTTSSALNGGGRFDPFHNYEQTIYGPPEMFDDYDPNKNMNEDIYGPPEMYEDYDPEENMEPDIYGPPEMFEDYDPEENMEPDIYGPPEMFEDYEPGKNIEPTIYGPPEMFEEPKTEETMKQESSDPDMEENVKRDGNVPSEEKEKTEEKQEIGQNGEEFTGTSEEYAPVENMEPLIYGPPEMFEK